MHHLQQQSELAQIPYLASERTQIQGLSLLFQTLCCLVHYLAVQIDHTAFQQKQDLQSDGKLTQ